MLANTMETGITMGDGQPMFDAQFKNVHAAALDAAALGKAIELLRTQPTSSGQPAGLSARHLIVAPDLEFSARRLVHESGVQIELQALAGLSAGRWFLLAAPDDQVSGATFNVSDLMIDRRDLLTRYAELKGIARALPARARSLPNAMDCARLEALGWQPEGLARLERFMWDVTR